MSHCLAGLTLGILSLVNDWQCFTNESLTSTSHTGTRSPPNNKPNNFASTQLSSPHLSAKSKATASETDVSERSVFGKTRRHTPKPKFSTMVAGGTCPEGHHDLEVKIILLGDYSVGKSSLLRVLARQSCQAGSDRDDNSHSMANASSRSSASLGNERLALVDTGSRGALVRSSLQPGGFVDVEFTHQERNVLARIADTGGESLVFGLYFCLSVSLTVCFSVCLSASLSLSLSLSLCACTILSLCACVSPCFYVCQPVSVCLCCLSACLSLSLSLSVLVVYSLCPPPVCLYFCLPVCVPTPLCACSILFLCVPGVSVCLCLSVSLRVCSLARTDC